MERPEHGEAGRLFELVCLDIVRLIRPGWTIEREARIEVSRYHSRRADAIIRRDEEVVVVEIKAYRSEYIPPQWISDALMQLDHNMEFAGASSGMLLLAGRVDAAEIRGFITTRPVEILDVAALRRFAERDSILLVRFDDILTRLGVMIESVGRAARGNRIPKTKPGRPIASRSLRGDELCGALRDVPAGPGTYTQFEVAVLNALKYIFDGQLEKWNPQHRDESGLRRDISAKIVGQHSFWQDLIRDFRTRYIIFESKNYTTEISQDEIHSTEKYLFVPALRTVAVIISPLGVDKGALKAIRGALRETGKLVLWLTVDEVCKMLHARDDGGEVHTILVEHMDDLLLEIAR